MFVKVPRESDLIKLPYQFARIVNVLENGDITFEVKYRVKQSDIVSKNAKIVKISVVSKIQTHLDINQMPGQSRPSNKQLVRNILTHMSTARNMSRNIESTIISKKLVDNMSKLDFNVINDLKRNSNPKNVASLYKSKAVLRSVNDLNTQNDIKPVLQVNREIADDDAVSSKNLIQQAILRHGFDPSHISEFVDEEILTTNESLNGVFLKSSQMNSWESTTRLFKKITKSTTSVPGETSTLSSDANVLSIETVFADEIELSTEITLPIDKIKDSAGNYKQTFFVFDLLGQNEISIQTIQESFDVLKYLEVFFTPRIPPLVTFSKFESVGRATIHVKQMDSRATAVKIYKKDFSYTNNDAQKYFLVSEHEIPFDGTFRSIPVEISQSSSTIFRVISSGKTDGLSSEFTNIVVNPTKIIKRRKYISLTSRVVSNGVNIDVTDVPFDVVSFCILRRDMTVKGNFEYIGDEVVQVKQDSESSVYTVTDVNAKKFHIYEYSCKLFFKNGSTCNVGSVLVDYEPLVENFVDTRIENLEVVRDIDNFDVQFSISTKVNDSTSDSIKKLLERQGLSDLFADDLLVERDKLQKLIAHQVYRVDLTEGVKENFGVITETSFSDSALRLINDVRKLQSGHAYRYEVTALLRAPETLFSEFVKTAVDPISKRTYSFKPSKFLHPITKRTGNITSPQSLSEHYSQSELSFGNVGNLSTIDVSFSNDKVSINHGSADSFDSKTHLLKWSISGKSDQIDHFLIMKEFLGQRKIIGKCHAQNEATTFRFFYELTSADQGEIEYIILPILDNYSVGLEFKTSKVSIT